MIRTAAATERAESGQESPQNGQEADRLRGTAHPLRGFRDAGRGASIGLRCRSARPPGRPASSKAQPLPIRALRCTAPSAPTRRAAAEAGIRCRSCPPSGAPSTSLRCRCGRCSAWCSSRLRCRSGSSLGAGACSASRSPIQGVRLHAAHHAQRPGPGLLRAAPRPGAELVSGASARRALARSSRVPCLGGTRLLQGRIDASRRWSRAVLGGGHHGQRAW